ncbi:MAG: YlcI/YnfO family protein [Ottowia sp.]|uniref:YlcI/YnfO family protein n=1 Tax=unclassified Ottowia TaxID=2645081 RepID=UPI003C2CA3E9
MKTAQLPPVRVTPLVRRQIEGVLHQGETLSQFIEQAATEEAERRTRQAEFIARGRASLARALDTGELYTAKDVLDAMQKRLDLRLASSQRRQRKAV